MATIIDELVKITEQRDIYEVAAECDVIYTDNTAKLSVKSNYAADPFRQALEQSRKKKVTCLAVFGEYFVKISPDPNWMRALSLYQEYHKTISNGVKRNLTGATDGERQA